MKIRQMIENDIDVVVNLEQKLFTDPWIRASFEYEVRHNKFSTPIILEENNKVVGYAIIWKIYEEFHLANFAIRPESQGKKLGTFFLKKILELRGSCSFALLEVREGNIQAIRLYEKFGFKTILKRPGYYKNGETALVMQKIFNPQLSKNEESKNSVNNLSNLDKLG